MRGKTVDQPCERSLSAAGRTAQYNNFTGADRQINIVHAFAGALLASIMKTDILKFDHMPAAPLVETRMTMTDARAAKISIAI